METLRLRQRPPVEDDLESWDEDDFVLENATFRSASSATSAPPNRRDSLSSHLSLRSDLESQHGEEEKQVLLPGDDEKSRLDAIAAAAKAGIPLPRSVPSSALTGGTIKRLGGRRIKRIMQDDWEHDLEIEDSPQGLHIKPRDQHQFPDVLRQVSGPSPTSPTKSLRPPPAIIQQPRMESETSHGPSNIWPAPLNLDKFRDTEDDDGFFGDGMATIKVSKTRQMVKPLSLITPPTPQKNAQTNVQQDDDFEKDFDLPSGGKLTLSTRRDIPKTPSTHGIEDPDWGEGSLGTRFGGTRREGRSNRSSSVSALSPSVASSITVESEDDLFDGLVLPTGPVNFKERLHQRKDSRSPERISEESSGLTSQGFNIATDKSKDELSDDFDLGDGEIFVASKLTNHRNLKIKETRQPSPTRPKTAVSLTFTNKPTTISSQSRLPRLSHDRTRSSLEPVSESGGPILQRTRRSLSRLGHSTQSSVSSIQTPTTPVSIQSLPPPTPRRQDLGTKPSAASLRNEPTTTSAQLLRLKRSLPVLRPTQNSPTTTAPSRFERPASRSESRQQQAFMRPKTPVERSRPSVESASAQARKNPVPFLPAGASQSQSQHITAKSSRVFRRHDSDNSIDLRPASRAVSRSTMRSPSPRRGRPGDEFWTRLSKPRKTKQFGDGHELDGFDDLPTSIQAESKFVKQPVPAGAKANVRNKIYQNVLPNRTATPSPLTPTFPVRPDYTPHFARDTAASRIAREKSLSHRPHPIAPVLSSVPLFPLAAHRVPQLAARSNLNPSSTQNTVRAKRRPDREAAKPHLISNLNSTKSPKVIDGMCYNPETFRWEGNENALNVFDAPVSSPSTASLPAFLTREKETASSRLALIANRSTVKGVQVVGGMVFDPKKMCWLKLGSQSSAKQGTTEDSMIDFDILDKDVDNDDDDDVFKDIPDLDDNTNDSTEGGHGRLSDIKDEWLVGEEFDVGPEFVRRQREEEVRWRKKCEKWIGIPRDQQAWRWTLRDLVKQFDQ